MNFHKCTFGTETPAICLFHPFLGETIIAVHLIKIWRLKAILMKRKIPLVLYVSYGIPATQFIDRHCNS
jgi:hypothetical protein